MSTWLSFKLPLSELTGLGTSCDLTLPVNIHSLFFSSSSSFYFYFTNYTYICVHSSLFMRCTSVHNDWGIQVNMLTSFNNSGSCCTTRMAGSVHSSSWQVLITRCPKGTGGQRGGFNHCVMDRRARASNWDVIKVKVVIIVSANWADKCVMAICG